MLTTYASWLSKIVTSIAQLYSVRILIEYLGLQNYAMYLILVAMLPWISLLDYGFGSAFQNKFSTNLNDENKISELKKNIISLQVILFLINIPVVFLITLISFNVIGENYMQSDSYFLYAVFIVYLLFSLNIITSLVYKVLYSLKMGHLSNIYPACASVITCLLLFCLNYFKFWDDEKLILSLLSLVVPALVMSVLSNVHILDMPKCKNFSIFNFNELKNIYKDAFTFLLFSLLVAASTNLDYFIISNTLDSIAIIEYGLLSKLFSFAYFFIYAHMLALWPKFSEEISKGNLQSIGFHLRKIYLYGVLFIVLFSLIFLIASDLVSKILTDSKVFFTYSGVLSFCIYYIVRTFYDGLSVAICSVNKQKFIVYYMPFQAVLGFLLQYYFSLKYGLEGVAFGQAISFLTIGIPLNILIYNFKIKSIF